MTDDPAVWDALLDVDAQRAAILDPTPANPETEELLAYFGEQVEARAA